MVKGCAPKIAKMTLFVLNFAVWCCSVVVLSLGIWMSVRSSKFAELFSEDYISTVAYMMIGIGAFLFIVGFSGCCGAKRESSFWLNIYFILMLAIIIVEVAAGIMAFVYSSQMEEFMRIGMNQTIATNYGYYDSATEVVDTLQENFECCGANSYKDYTYSAFMQESIGRAVPISCCKTTQDCGLGTPGNPTITLSVWPNGCVSVSIDTAKSNVVALGAVCLAVLAVEVAAMIFACCLKDAVSG
ncbi:tetraspanin-11-like isoform X2 [Apostichopus japonicus]|uniref:tetraspanin-11-like isoform X2 n=1 Tax=Stichopus japonicus TaxID=307972 RepID=UPI003AB1F32F